MKEFLGFLKKKKNLTSVLILGILILALPLGVDLLRKQQIIRSRAAVDPIVFRGSEDVFLKDGKWVAKKDAKISFELTSPLGPPGEPVVTPAPETTPIPEPAASQPPPPSVTDNAMPAGKFSSVDCNSFAGTASDADSSTLPVDFWLIKNAGNNKDLSANVYLGQIRASGGSFNFSTQNIENAAKATFFSGTARDIWAAAINVNSEGANVTTAGRGHTNLGTLTVNGCAAPGTITGTDNARPQGYVVRASSECTNITGWACDRDFASGPIQIDFWDHTTSPALYLGATTTTSVWDAPSSAACGLTGNQKYGYTFAIPSSVRTGTPHTVRAYGINVNSVGTVVSGSNGSLHKVLTVAGGSDMNINCR